MAAGLVFAGSAVAQDKELRGIALVIGQSDYEHIAKLPNPENDARAVEEMLDELGFETDVATDRDARRAAGATSKASSRMPRTPTSPSSIIPATASRPAARIFWCRSMPTSRRSRTPAKSWFRCPTMIAELKTTVPVTIVLLDACRNNPFPPGAVLKLRRTTRPSRSAPAGLGETRGVVALKPAGSADGPTRASAR